MDFDLSWAKSSRDVRLNADYIGREGIRDGIFQNQCTFAFGLCCPMTKVGLAQIRFEIPFEIFQS
jgi:hypothetical protein